MYKQMKVLGRRSCTRASVWRERRATEARRRVWHQRKEDGKQDIKDIIGIEVSFSHRAPNKHNTRMLWSVLVLLYKIIKGRCTATAFDNVSPSRNVSILESIVYKISRAILILDESFVTTCIQHSLRYHALTPHQCRSQSEGDHVGVQVAQRAEC